MVIPLLYIFKKCNYSNFKMIKHLVHVSRVDLVNEEDKRMLILVVFSEWTDEWIHRNGLFLYSILSRLFPCHNSNVLPALKSHYTHRMRNMFIVQLYLWPIKVVQMCCHCRLSRGLRVLVAVKCRTFHFFKIGYCHIALHRQHFMIIEHFLFETTINTTTK